jgi:putative toxin-antitoxin system antitoxin component (TIGR02293 family)
MTETERIVRILGGEEVVGRKLRSRSDLIPVLRKGLRYRALDRVMDGLDLTQQQVVDSLALSKRTLARRKGEGRLSAEESDRLYRIARVAARAEEVFGSTDTVKRWLVHPNRALGGSTPLSLLDTYEGTSEVEAVLGRIEHGVFS